VHRRLKEALKVGLAGSDWPAHLLGCCWVCGQPLGRIQGYLLQSCFMACLYNTYAWPGVSHPQRFVASNCRQQYHVWLQGPRQSRAAASHRRSFLKHPTCRLGCHCWRVCCAHPTRGLSWWWSDCLSFLYWALASSLMLFQLTGWSLILGCRCRPPKHCHQGADLRSHNYSYLFPLDN
jgi:hypothetical protein